jgi:hypothetical protein
MIAASLATLKDGQRADEVAGTSIEAAAQLFNVGRASVERARIVREQGNPDLAAAVERGEISVSGAVEQIRRGITTGVAMDPYSVRGLDLYETPPEAVRALLGVESFAGATIWEPACGPGAIVRVLRASGHRVIATDVKDYGCPDSKGGVDFLLEQRAPEGVTAILTNPPYMHANAFVRHALALAPRVAMLLRLAFIESAGRSDFLDSGQLARVHVFRNRLPMMHRNGWAGPQASSAICLAWFIWERAHRGAAMLDRISSQAGDKPDSAPPPAAEPESPPEPPAEAEPLAIPERLRRRRTGVAP